MTLTSRIHNPDYEPIRFACTHGSGPCDRIVHVPPADRRVVDVQPLIERRESFVAPWRRRQIQQAGGRFVAVADTTEAA